MSGERENYFCILELLFCTLQSVEDKIAKYTGLATTCRLFSCIYPQMTKTSWSKNEWLFKKENKTKRALSYCQAANLKAEKESMYSKLLIWSTINTKSAICKTWQIFLPLLPVWRQARQPHFHRTWDFRAFSRGRCEDCSLALSLRKMSGIFDGDLLLSPEALFASNMPQCCFCFLQTSGEREMIPPGNSSTGLCEVRRHEAAQWEGTRAEHGSPALAQPCPGTALLRHSPAPAAPTAALAPAWRPPGLHGALCSVTQTHSFQRLFWQSFPHEVKDKGISDRVEIGKLGPKAPLCWTDKNIQPFIYKLKNPVCSFKEIPSFSRTERVSCSVGKLARPPGSTDLLPEQKEHLTGTTSH